MTKGLLPFDERNELDGELFERAWSARRAAFPDEIGFSAPSFKHYRTVEFATSGEQRFSAVSITGDRCALGCEHCRGKLLRSMVPADEPSALLELAHRLAERGCRGMLLSGGCDPRGRVPLAPFLEVVREIKSALDFEVAVHVGLADEGLAKALVEAQVDRIMMDLVGERETIERVLHLEAAPADFERSLSCLVEAGLEVVPHIVVGLHFGRIFGEEKAVEIAARHRISALALVVMRPEKGTPFQSLEGADVDATGLLMARTRLRLPTTHLVLGCARPVGRPARALEAYALRAGFNGVAFPADETVELARELGLRATFAERCCAI